MHLCMLALALCVCIHAWTHTHTLHLQIRTLTRTQRQQTIIYYRCTYMSNMQYDNYYVVEPIQLSAYNNREFWHDNSLQLP